VGEPDFHDQVIGASSPGRCAIGAWCRAPGVRRLVCGARWWSPRRPIAYS